MATTPIKLGTSTTYSIGTGGSGGTSSWISASTTMHSGPININGDAVFKGNITWQDRDMREWFESVEARLAVLHPNPKLEQEWSELADLRMKYVELEKKLLEKQRVFNILKKSDLELNNL